MNTIEQAQEVSSHLRKYSLVSPQTVDVIDALIEELAKFKNELLAAEIRIENDAMELTKRSNHENHA